MRTHAARLARLNTLRCRRAFLLACGISLSLTVPPLLYALLT